MKSSLGDKQRILHMLECIDEINRATKELNREDFIRNSVVRIATVQWIEIYWRSISTYYNFNKRKIC